MLKIIFVDKRNTLTAQYCINTVRNVIPRRIRSASWSNERQSDYQTIIREGYFLEGSHRLKVVRRENYSIAEEPAQLVAKQATLITRYLRSPLEITAESNGRFRESRDGAANGPQWGKIVVLSDTPICRISRNYHDSGIRRVDQKIRHFMVITGGSVIWRVRLPSRFGLWVYEFRENLDFAPLNLRFHSDSGMM